MPGVDTDPARYLVAAITGVPVANITVRPIDYDAPAFRAAFTAAMVEGEAAYAIMQRRDLAIRRFKRAMRRHEKRALAMGLGWSTWRFLCIKREGVLRNRRNDLMLLVEESLREMAAPEYGDAPSAAYLYARAADAVAKLRAALAAEAP